ncbi:hypothetical protein [Kutzneria kofuensis]|uniref:Uncharacterized protein n=1 Tax=Kutzneria kofuensis TaxID=103725 RepID=A0A7W9KPG4_9PSEU|nr:hypothetical protein [Kutzneria kofuensis]MBB5896323.1 hypothetical protein [Kutzneria kofuensis]
MAFGSGAVVALSVAGALALSPVDPRSPVVDGRATAATTAPLPPGVTPLPAPGGGSALDNLVILPATPGDTTGEALQRPGIGQRRAVSVVSTGRRPLVARPALPQPIAPPQTPTDPKTNTPPHPVHKAKGHKPTHHRAPSRHRPAAGDPCRHKPQ